MLICWPCGMWGSSAGPVHCREGCFDDADPMWRDANQLPAWKWWQVYAKETPQLQRVAVRILSLGTSAGAAERAWSAMDFVQNKRRNRLLPERTSDLVYVFQVSRNTWYWLSCLGWSWLGLGWAGVASCLGLSPRLTPPCTCQRVTCMPSDYHANEACSPHPPPHPPRT